MRFAKVVQNNMSGLPTYQQCKQLPIQLYRIARLSDVSPSVWQRVKRQIAQKLKRFTKKVEEAMYTQKLSDFLTSRHFQHRTTCAYTEQQNGTGKPLNWTL